MSEYVEMNSKMLFLIVDPISSNQEALKINLKKMGYTNFEVKETGLEAINYIREESVDFIMCRMDLPDMSGVELLEDLKNDLTIDRVPFLMFSEDLDAADLALIEEIGADAHLTIPFVTKQLAEKVMTTWTRYIDPENVEFKYEKARRHFVRKEYEEALAIFAEIEGSGKIQSRVQVAGARVVYEQGDIEVACAKAKTITETKPDFVHAHQLLGEILVESNQVIEAVAAFKKALDLSPKNPYRYQIISEICLALECYTEVELILKRAEKLGMQYDFVIEGLATALIKLDKKEEALKYYERLSELSPSVRNYNNLAICYKKLEQLTKSIEYYNKALDLAPHDTRIRFNLGLVWLAYGKPVKAIKELKKVLEIDPKHERASLRLLSLEDPEAYKKRLKERKNGDSSENGQVLKIRPDEEDSVDIKKSALMEKITLSEKDQNEIAKMLKAVASQSAQENDSNNLVLDPEVSKRLHKLGVVGSQYYYLQGVKKIRRQYYGLMKGWLGSIIEISEELGNDILKITSDLIQRDSDVEADAVKEVLNSNDPKSHPMYSTIQKAISESKDLTNSLQPIMHELQFQDYTRQSLVAMEEGYKASYEKIDPDKAWSEVESCLVTVDDKALFRQIVLGEEEKEESEEAAVSGSDVLFF